jgi:hypothetical protein
MLEIIRDVTVIIVAIVMALPLAHALEWPGKLRLSKDHYLAMLSHMIRAALGLIALVLLVAAAS